MRHTALSTVLVLTSVFAATPAQGGPIGVKVLSAKFTATVGISTFWNAPVPWGTQKDIHRSGPGQRISVSGNLRCRFVRIFSV